MKAEQNTLLHQAGALIAQKSLETMDEAQAVLLCRDQLNVPVQTREAAIQLIKIALKHQRLSVRITCEFFQPAWASSPPIFRTN